MSFKYTDFGGCTHGLLSRRAGSDGPPVRKPWRIAFISSTINKHRYQLCDGSHPQIPCNGLDATHSQGYTPSICCAIKKSVQDGQFRPSRLSTCTVNVCISASFQAQTNSAICVAAPFIGDLVPSLDPARNRMASSRGPSQAKEDDRIVQERLAKERAKLQAIAERNRVKIAQEKREREEAAQAAGAAKAARKKVQGLLLHRQKGNHHRRSRRRRIRGAVRLPHQLGHAATFGLSLRNFSCRAIHSCRFLCCRLPRCRHGILPETKTHFSSNSAGRMAKPVENWRFCIIRHYDAAGFGWR
jgi:hypothetical protein